jgi:hypothetical protein
MVRNVEGSNYWKRWLLRDLSKPSAIEAPWGVANLARTEGLTGSRIALTGLLLGRRIPKHTK